ncbi:ribokinase [Zhihengliuella sp.]|uniref:ribokinase n=1 Tax=Zhihengliuella sp. TaxID=1954483 RepID=UPI0028124F9B|nr:ribokinase [Zhihengliuella sp.]
MNQPARVTVIGSSNADLAVSMPRLPGPGETVLAHSFTVSPGGKGANQALAAALAGASTEFVGAVGRDANADEALRLLREAGVELGRVRTVDGPTGVALISIDDGGENSIAVVPGANGTVTADFVREVGGGEGAGGLGHVVVLQGEIPAAAVEEAVRQATAGGSRVVLNLAPVIELAAEAVLAADPLVANEHEAALVLEMLGAPVAADADAETMARELCARGLRSVVITLGAAGSLVAEVGQTEYDGGRDQRREPALTRVEAVRVSAVDTTGAGDAYTGALAARLAHGDSLVEAAGFAAKFSAASVTRPGAQASYPRSLDAL